MCGRSFVGLCVVELVSFRVLGFAFSCRIVHLFLCGCVFVPFTHSVVLCFGLPVPLLRQVLPVPAMSLDLVLLAAVLGC